MTNLELDVVMRRVLLDSLRKDEDEDCIFSPSKHHLREMKYMLKDPAKWQRNRTKPVWKQIVQKVAVILLIVSIAFGGVMVVSPTARAAVVRWVLEVYETHIVYRFLGEQRSEAMPIYMIPSLPEGFVETDRIVHDATVSLFYEDAKGNFVALDYVHMQQGAFTLMTTDQHDVVEVTINNLQGKLFLPKNPAPGWVTELLWIDPSTNIQFWLSSTLGATAVMDMANSVTLIDSGN